MKSAGASQTKLLAGSSAPEPNISGLPFASWIPTANGRLSYRHIGESSHPSNATYTNISPSDSTRYILAIQVRPLSDLLFQKITHSFSKRSGDIPFAICAKTSPSSDDDYAISGNIFLFASKETFRKKDARETQNLIDRINERRFKFDPANESIVRALWLSAKHRLRRHCDTRIYFKLMRTGEVFFSSPTFKDKVFEQKSITYADQEGHDFRFWIANQAYFFLRDLCHNHQHHDAHSDTILILQRRLKGNELRWRRNVIYSLHFALIRARRHNDGVSLARAMGLLGYSNSFQKICERVPNWIDPAYNSDELRQSIESRLTELTFRNADKDRITSKNRAVNGTLLATFAVISAYLIMLVQPSISDHTAPPILEKLALISSILFLPLILSLLILYLLALVILMKSPDDSSNGVRREILELANAKRNFSIILSYASGTVIALLSLYFGKAMIFYIVQLLVKWVSDVK